MPDGYVNGTFQNVNSHKNCKTFENPQNMAIIPHAHKKIKIQIKMKRRINEKRTKFVIF